MILPAFGVTVEDFERLRDGRLRAGGHHLRLGAQRVEAGGELRPGRLHGRHPRQALPRGDQGDREPGDEAPRRAVPGRAQHGRGAAGLRFHRARRRRRGAGGAVRPRGVAGVRLRARSGPGGNRQPDHDALRRVAGDRARRSAQHGPPLRRGRAPASTSGRSTPSAPPPRNGRTRWWPCWTSRSTSWSWWAGTTRATPATSPRWCEPRGAGVPHRGCRRGGPGRADHPPPADRHQAGGGRHRLARPGPGIGITAGASTPNNKIGETIARICERPASSPTWPRDRPMRSISPIPSTHGMTTYPGLAGADHLRLPEPGGFARAVRARGGVPDRQDRDGGQHRHLRRRAVPPLRRWEDLSALSLDALADLDAVVVRAPGGLARWMSPRPRGWTWAEGGAGAYRLGCSLGHPTVPVGQSLLTAEAAEHLAARAPCWSGSTRSTSTNLGRAARPVHSTLLAAGIPIAEHLTGLAGVPDRDFRFSAVPAKVAGFGTWPVRAYARLAP